jgi:hypothetical protein
MQHILKIGFRNKPLDLAEVLQEQGFKIYISGGEGIDRTVYAALDQRIDAIDRDVPRGLGIEYLGEVGDHEIGLLQADPNLEACATIVAHTVLGDLRGGGFFLDKDKQWTVALVLRDHYNAVLYDPQEGREVRE